MAVLAQSPVEIVRHVFARQVCDNPDTVERHASRSGALRYRAGFHFHDASAGGAQPAFLPGGLRNVIDGTNHTHVMRPQTGRVQSREGARSGGNRGTDDYVGNLEFLGQRAAEAGAEDDVRGKVLQGGFDSGSGALGAGSVGRQHQFVGAEPGGARPIQREVPGGHASSVRQDAWELHGV